MSAPRIVSVNVAMPRTLQEKPLLVSGIDKLPRLGPVAVSDAGLEGDGVGDTTWHGGTFQAVYAFALEDYEHWGAELGGPLRPGFFGDNLTTAGIDLNSCLVGEQWRIGTTRLQVSSVRTPCGRFQRWLELSRLPAEDWVERFTRRGRPGVYLTVLERGWVQSGDPVEVLDVPAHGITTGTMFRALTTEPSLLPLLLELDGLPLHVYEKAEKYAAAASR